MLKTNYGRREYDPEALLEKVVGAVAGPGRKAVAAKLNKGYSTFTNELANQSGYKLGLDAFVRILLFTGDFAALDMIEDLVGRTAFFLPEEGPADPVDLMQMGAGLTREFSKVLSTTAKALEDGELDPQEALDILSDLEDLIKVCVHLRGYLGTIV